MADTSQPDLADAEEGGKKRKRLMMLIAFAGVSALSLSTAGIVVATSSVSSSPASVEAEAAAAAPPEIVPGSLGDEDADQIATPSGETDLPTEIDAVEDDPVDEPLWPIGPPTRLPDLRPSTPTAPAPSVIPDATQPEPSPLQPAPAEPTQKPSPALPTTPTASPSATPQPEPTGGGGVAAPGTGAGHGDEEGGDPSTPHPGDTSEEGGAGTSPDPTESPASEDEPSTGGGDEVNAQQLSIAIQHEAYHLLMHVKGVFDLEGATWRIAAGDLPEGLTIDPATGTISGRTLAEPGRYVFQLEVANSQRAIRGWFLMVVAKPITPAPEPGDDSTANPDPGHGNGSGEDGGSVPMNPSEPDAPDAGGETPGPGADPDAPANPDAPGTGTDPVVPGGGTGQVDPGDAATPTPTAPATEEPAQPASPSPTPTPSASGNETPSEPVDGEGSEVEPADPEIDQGAGGIQIDKIEFSLSPRISFTVGSEIDLDLGATSSTGLAIAYVAEGLPSWLNIVDGHLRGTAPSTTGSFNLTVTAKNEKGSVAQRSAVYVLPAHIEMDTTPLQMVSGQALSTPLEASNGASNANFVYTLISAQGATATIDESTLTASYALPGTYELVIEAQDVNSPQISRNTFRIPVVVDVVPLTISLVDIDATQYVTTLERFTAAGGWGGYQFRVVEGSLPAGLSLKWDGTLSGAPRDTDTRSVTIEVVDNKGLTARGGVTITVKGNPAITPAGSLTTAVGPYSAIFSADSSQLYLATNQTISLVDIATSTTIKQLKIGTNRSAALSPDGNRYAVAADGALQVYDAKTLEKVNEIKVGTSAMAVVWSADSNTLHFARSKSGSVAELVSYDASTGAVLGSVAFGKTGSGWRIEAIADGRVLATASGSSGIYVLDTLSGTTRLITPTLTSYFVAAAPGNTAWTGAGGTLRRVDLETGDVLATHSITGIVLAGLTMSPDGRWLYVSDSRNLIAVDTRDGSEVVRVPLPSGMSPRTTVSPDGRMVAVTGGPNTTTLLKFTASD